MDFKLTMFNNFRGLGLKITVIVWIRVRVGVWLGLLSRVRVTVVLWSG